ncbi:MAG: CPBP family intramembrane metalloprotease [Chloroflexi bacterium]|nr:MAG: CPBP family intramembrane metalloprotease [Chloroflexota bacterium]
MLFMAGWRVSGEVKSGDSRGSGIDTVVVAWIIAVFAITALRALPLFFYHLNLSKLSFTSRIPIWVGIGIEVTAYAPTLAALLVVATVPGGGGIRRLLRPIGQWRVNVSWYVLALVGPSALFLVGDVVRLALGLALPPQWLIVPGAATLAFLIGALIAGSFGEEVGWRGLGQPRLQARYGALLAAVMIGAVWSLWHLWPAAAPGGLNLTTWSDGVLTFIRLIATSVVYAWIYNGERPARRSGCDDPICRRRRHRCRGDPRTLDFLGRTRGSTSGRAPNLRLMPAGARRSVVRPVPARSAGSGQRRARSCAS